MHSTFEDDEESIGHLQEVFGYILTGDYSIQKIPMFIGKTRAGKSIAAWVLCELVGKHNVSSPSLDHLGQHFGLASTVDKRLCYIPDVRINDGRRKAKAKEALLKISGRDQLTIGVKYKQDWVGYLDAKLLIISNEAPKLEDISQALTERYVPVVFNNSFLGREDIELTKKLRPELPGILNWSVEGYKRLLERGKFELPQSSKLKLEELRDLSSPVKVFFDDNFVLDPNGSIDRQDVGDMWGEFCERMRFTASFKSNQQLYADILQVAEGHVECKRGTTGKRRYQFFGMQRSSDAMDVPKVDSSHKY